MTIKPSSGRRRFLATLGVGSVAAAATAVTQSGESPEPSSVTAASGQGKGYQLTEHVRKYYRTAKV
jgi:hypothetical protein